MAGPHLLSYNLLPKEIKHIWEDMGLHTGPLALQATAQNTRQYNIFHQKIEVLLEGILLFTLASALRQYFL